ncbi:MAG: FliH/SctL family protein [Burkholderiales bacterium]|nr:FliH/SctL family protein [Burkholderiales bacterium]MDP2399262.1 FliH/SctL family protein [Burkholderiales bacterium]
MSSTVIPREKLSAYQRWELNSFDGAGSTREMRSPATAAAPDPATQREAYEAGYREGLAAAKADVARATAAQTARLNDIINNLNRNLAQLDVQVADGVLDFGLTLARRMVGDALEQHPELVTSVVREGLQLLGQARAPARLLLHPDDARLVREQLGDQCSLSGWTIAEDAGITAGGCRLESAGGELDATVEIRWKRLLAAFGRDGKWPA